ncbi:putative transcription factor [Gottschalkia purinilytica]|uniref:Putative transcription factor n=1 Tax=Gottschalkia purinilytica TaxID=1503 RepID=A0A0L0W635_GOTPU|nr:helix-turn-helix transcriptional regulator [Gottschalkia purinilytica]KNF06978.1 putative transcription factor [Gottschalkia purinilytica]
MEVGKRIRDLRRVLDMTTYELAQKTGFSQSTISKIETGKRKIDIDTLETIAKALKVSPSKLLEEESVKKEDKFETPGDAMKFILEQNVIMNFGDFDIDKMSDKQVIEFANELLRQLELISHKYKK